MGEGLSKSELMTARPGRAAGVEAVRAGEGKWRVSVAMRSRTWARRILRLPETTTRTFELDERGKFVFEACDGETSVEAIIEKLAIELSRKREELEPATLKFLDMLLRRGMIVIAVEK